jgi:hypothetical protein
MLLNENKFMVTPEVQNYIKQSREQGISDSQIRQNLSAQGWTESDIATALTGAGSAQMTIATKAILVAVGSLVVIGAAVAGYMKYKTNSSAPETSMLGNVSENPETGCNGPELDYFKANLSGTSLPAVWPEDMPVYPNSKFIGWRSFGDSNQFYTIAYCTPDSFSEVSDFFVTNKSAWTFSVGATAPDGQELVAQKGDSDIVFIVATSGSVTLISAQLRLEK